MANQTFRITTTPRARFALSVMLFHKDVKFNDRGKERALRNARRALGLMEPSQNYAEHQRVGEIWRDHVTRNVFEVTADNADFILTTLAKIEKHSVDMLYLEELLEQLEDKRDAEDASTAVPFDEAAEAPAWKPPLTPIVGNPALLVDIIREAFEAESYGAARKLILPALKPEPEPGAAAFS
jgi:hypothetical protein